MADENSLALKDKSTNPVVGQMVNVYKRMPLSQKLVIVVVVCLIAAAFTLLFMWANKIEYQTVYSGLSAEDASQILQKLKDEKIPYKAVGDGTTIMVPSERVYDVRLSLAASGLPKGSGVGFEIFDKTDFGTTEFVQKLNYQRALQGELARTIKEFREIEDARVMIVMPKESVFIEEAKPSSASVLLNLRSSLPKEKVSAVVHLVASAVEGLDPEMITVVDTDGHVLSKGVPDDKNGEGANSQLEYKMAYEQNLAKRLQSMLESIVGEGKAIVRVTADMDFNQVDLSEEVFDPDVQVVRSRHNIMETSDNKAGPGKIASVNPVTPTGNLSGMKESSETSQKQNEIINYEINRTVKKTVKPVGVLQRLSVAAVLDGTYTVEKDKDGKQIRKYTARTQAELDQFVTVLRQAMGYNADREDQISIESFPFSHMEEMTESKGLDWKPFFNRYGRMFMNGFLIIILLIAVVKPLLKTARNIQVAIENTAAIAVEEEQKKLEQLEGKLALTDVTKMSPREKAAFMAQGDVKKTTNIMRIWIKDSE